MSKTAKVIIIASCLLIITVLAFIFLPRYYYPSGDPLKVGVLLPLTGPDADDSKPVLEWMTEDLNKSGGIGGRPVQLVYKDTNRRDCMTLAREFISDPSIKIVIGPERSTQVHDIAPLFINSKKILISPLATAGNIFRAYGKKDYIWRTCQSDIAQVRAILNELSNRGATRISLISADDAYGSTFLDWTGFFCTELGIDLLNTISYNDSSDPRTIMDQALAGGPEYIVIATHARASAEFAKLANRRNIKDKIIFTDATETPYIIDTLGSGAEGYEVMSFTSDPKSGFDQAFIKRYGYSAFDMTATSADAFLLAVYTLARQESQSGFESLFHPEPIAESFKKIINGTGPEIKWREYDRGIDMILKGGSPDIEGAAGPLRFDKEFGVDPVEGYYALNRIEKHNGITDFYKTRIFSSLESKDIGVLGEGSSVAVTHSSRRLAEVSKTGQIFKPARARKGLRAVIVSASDGWNNYRHQADALALYQLLRRNGLSDRDIILFSVDDIPWMPENLKKGDMRHEVGGVNLRGSALIDYSGAAVTPDNLRKVLLGQKSGSTPVVLDTNDSCNVLFYMVGHGMPRVVNFPNGQQLTDRKLAELIGQMQAAKRFRQMLIMVEACYGESMAYNIDTPGVLFLTGSSRIESSFGANYDPKIRQWLSDEFTVRALNTMEEPDTSLEELYLDTYTYVTGSHVTLVNNQNFGDLDTRVSEFTEP